MPSKIPHHHWILAAFILLFGKLSAQEVAINELMSSNTSTVTDEDNSFEDWIELYNYGNTPVSLKGFGLSDDAKVPFKWVFPNVSLAPNQHLMVWASDKNRTVPGMPLHTNFKISASGEKIVLTRADSTLLDSVGGISLAANISYGRQPDGTGAWVVFNTPTPNATNTAAPGPVSPPTFSHASGLYTGAFDLSLSHANSNVTIVYTLDGSEPDINNLGGTSYQYKNQYQLQPADSVGPFLNSTYTTHTYTTAINVHDRSSEQDKYARMNTRQHVIYTPVQPVRKGTVVKAKAYVGNVGSKTIMRNFFVWSKGNPFKIPVISYQIQEDYMFDYEKGVYTAGKDFDTWRANNPTNNQWYRPEFCNYWRSGKEWEYPAHVEIFDPAGFTSVTSKNAGFRIHGNNSRAFAIKSLRLYAREEGNFELDLFDEEVFGATNAGNKEFKRIMMRGEGTGGPVYYDVVFNRLMQPVFEGVTRIKPAVHFINGEYWGLTALRDRFDEHHYALNYNLNPDNIVKIDCSGNNCDLDIGETADYTQYIGMRDFIIANDMAVPANFAKVDSMLCMESFIDHIVLEIYASNDSYERSYWKVRTRENDGYGDGKFRMSVQDFEASLKSNIDWLRHWADITNSPNEALLGHLLANPGFRDKFINRFADLINTAFTPGRFKAIIDTALSEVAPYLTEDANRFPRTSFYRASENLSLTNWANNRPAIQRDSIRAFFKLNGTFNITCNVSDPNAGYVKVNTVDIKQGTPGVAQNPYPWMGVYFAQVPVTLKATAKPGYSFSHWSGDTSTTIDSITITTSNNLQIVANFTKDSVPVEVEPVYFWLMDNKIANDTPLQALPVTYAKNTLAATLQYTSCLSGYPFNAQHANWRKASMERRNAPTGINYRAKANNNTPYANVNMRGIQVKQPFRKDSLENTITLNIPTTGLQQIKISFATESDGAAEELLVDYWDGAKWSVTNMPQSAFAIDSAYSLTAIDFSQVDEATHNANFKVRIRFNGPDMEADKGLRVHFNNIAVDGEVYVPSGLPKVPNVRANVLHAFPNPVQHTLVLESNKPMQTVTIFNLYGQHIKMLNNAGENCSLSLEQLPTSLYMVRVQWEDQEKTIRIIKQ